MNYKKVEQKPISDFKRCPHCGSTAGYYNMIWVRDCYNFEGAPKPEREDLLKETPFYLCVECNQRIAKKKA